MRLILLGMFLALMLMASGCGDVIDVTGAEAYNQETMIPD